MTESPLSLPLRSLVQPPSTSLSSGQSTARAAIHAAAPHAATTAWREQDNSRQWGAQH